MSHKSRTKTQTKTHTKHAKGTQTLKTYTNKTNQTKNLKNTVDSAKEQFRSNSKTVRVQPEGKTVTKQQIRQSSKNLKPLLTDNNSLL